MHKKKSKKTKKTHKRGGRGVMPGAGDGAFVISQQNIKGTGYDANGHRACIIETGSGGTTELHISDDVVLRTF